MKLHACALATLMLLPGSAIARDAVDPEPSVVYRCTVTVEEHQAKIAALEQAIDARKSSPEDHATIMLEAHLAAEQAAVAATEAVGDVEHDRTVERKCVVSVKPARGLAR